MTQAQENSEEEVIQQADIQPDEAKEESVEIEVINEEKETEAESNTEEKKPFDPKTDKVEFNTPEQQEKFNYMYKQTKMSDSRNQMLTDLLQKQQTRLDELEGRFKQTDSADAERILLGKIKQARDSG